MASDKILTSRLFTTTAVEGRTDLDEKYDRAYNTVINLTRNLSEKESHDVLNKVMDDTKVHDEVSVGLLIGALSDPVNAPRHYHDLTLVSRDSLKVVTDTLIHIIGEKYSRLLDIARQQLLWLVREMVKTGVNNVEAIVWGLLRQIAGGDISPKNVWLAENLVDILRDSRPWLDKFSVIVACVAYTYLRILEDHHGPQFANLRQKEVNFVLGLLRERFQDCLKIGRDLVRLLQNIARIPEIEGFWRDLLHNPTSLAPNFTGIHQLLQMRTSRRYFVVRLTPEMEKKMVYLCSDVKFGSQRRYQEWFQRQYLNTPESQTLRCDLIRFLIGCIHPPNEVLCSDIIPRWAVIGWLISTCTSPVPLANSKLALFYDWLFYSIEMDNIMNIEPGILVMYHSLKRIPCLTTSLLDFLCRIIPNFHPTLTDKVRGGVCNSLRQIIEKGVVQSLEPLFDSRIMDQELKKLVKDTFPEFCVGSPQLNEMKHDDFVTPVSNSSAVTKMDLMVETGLDFGSPVINSDSEVSNSNHIGEDEAMFSDGDEEEEDSKHLVQEQIISNKLSPLPVNNKARTEEIANNAVDSIKTNSQVSHTVVTSTITTNSIENECKHSLKAPFESLSPEKRIELNKHLEFLEKDMKGYLEEFLLEKNNQIRCDILQKMCDLIFSDDLDGDETQHMALCLSYLLENDLNSEQSLLPMEVSPENIESSLNKPLYVLFDNLVTLTEDDHRRRALLLLLVEMHKESPSLGYHLLYFLKAGAIRPDREQNERTASFQTYKDLCKSAGQKDFNGFILKDLQICCERDPRLISWIIPELYQNFPKQTMGSSDLLQMVLERLDSSQLHDLVCMVLQGSLQMFDHNSFTNILEKSLQWETVEQIFLWQLARAHEIPVDCCLSVLPKLKFSSHTATVMSTHGEALSNILMMLRRKSPSENLLRHLLLRELRPSDPTVATILQYWVQRYEDKMAKLIEDIINTKQQPSPNKRKRNQCTRQGSSVPLEQVLSHLNHLRIACEQTKFFALKTMQSALQTARNQCSEFQKKKFSDLFALIEEDEEAEPEPEPEPQRKTKSNRGRKPKARKKRESESEEESSEQDEDVKKPLRKKRKNNQVGSDSD